MHTCNYKEFLSGSVLEREPFTLPYLLEDIHLLRQTETKNVFATLFINTHGLSDV